MYTHDFAIYCKSFRDDFDRLQIMLDTIAKRDSNCPVLLSVPYADLNILRQKLNIPDFVTVIDDESYTITGEKFVQGWFQQQVCKLSVHRTKFSKSYVMIDSDTYFINDFDVIRHQCADYNVIASFIFTKYFQGNDALVRYILSPTVEAPKVDGLMWNDDASQKILELNGRISEIENLNPNEKGVFINQIFGIPKLALQPSQYFHSEILFDFENFLSEIGLNFYDCIRISPWEYNWYASYALTKHSKLKQGVCSPILHFASEADVVHAKSLGLNIERIRSRFVAIQMAARHFTRMNFED